MDFRTVKSLTQHPTLSHMLQLRRSDEIHNFQIGTSGRVSSNDPYVALKYGVFHEIHLLIQQQWVTIMVK